MRPLSKTSCNLAPLTLLHPFIFATQIADRMGVCIMNPNRMQENKNDRSRRSRRPHRFCFNRHQLPRYSAFSTRGAAASHLDGKIIHHKGAESRLHFRAPYKVTWAYGSYGVMASHQIRVLREKICEKREGSTIHIPHRSTYYSCVLISREFIFPATLIALPIMMMTTMPRRKFLTN